MNASVLLVDDDPISNFVTERSLWQVGVAREIRSALNGKQAIDVIKDLYDRGIPFPNIILLDLNMPIMNGFQFIEALNGMNLANLEKIKIIIVTSSEDRNDIARAQSLGVTEYWVKPVTVENFEKVHIFS